MIDHYVGVSLDAIWTDHHGCPVFLLENGALLAELI